jgi:hypothetical protein
LQQAKFQSTRRYEIALKVAKINVNYQKNTLLSEDVVTVASWSNIESGDSDQSAVIWNQQNIY